MSPLLLLILFSSSFAVSSAGECILSPDSIDAIYDYLGLTAYKPRPNLKRGQATAAKVSVNSLWTRAFRYKHSLACHADEKTGEYIYPARKWDDFKKFPGEEGNLGTGSSARVEKVKVKGTDPSRVFAMKVYRSTTKNEDVLNELTISTLLSHDPGHHFVKPYYFFVHRNARNNPELGLVMDYVLGGSLHRLISTVGRMHWEDTIPLAYLLLHALEYAHSQRIIYRDLKPENILLDAETGFKITDFDRAAHFEDRHHHNDFAGTFNYMPPEYFLNEPRTETVDTWGVGAVLWTAIEGRPMHENKPILDIEEKYRELIDNSEPFPLPAAIPKEGSGGLYRNLLNKLLEFEFFDKTSKKRKKRPTCAGILKSEEGRAVFAPYEQETGRKLTELAFSPTLDKDGKLIGYNYHGRQHEHYRDLGVLREDANSIPIKDGS